ncbi:MAG: hypothetical protein WDW38_002086 [Sanguina aurantia]
MSGGHILHRDYSLLRSPPPAQPSHLDWATIFADPTAPLVVDLGCGSGRHLLLLAHRYQAARAAAAECHAASSVPSNSEHGSGGSSSSTGVAGLGGGSSSSSSTGVAELGGGSSSSSSGSRCELGSTGGGQAHSNGGSSGGGGGSSSSGGSSVSSEGTLSFGPASPNFLGIDIQAAVMARANRWAASRDLSASLYFHLGQVTGASLNALLVTYPGPLSYVSIQYPDPHRNKERHMVTQELVEGLGRLLQPGGRVLLSSDVEGTASFMRDAFQTWGGSSFQLDPSHFAGRDGTAASSSDNSSSANTSSSSASTSASSSSSGSGNNSGSSSSSGGNISGSGSGGGLDSSTGRPLSSGEQSSSSSTASSDRAASEGSSGSSDSSSGGSSPDGAGTDGHLPQGRVSFSQYNSDARQTRERARAAPGSRSHTPERRGGSVMRTSWAGAGWLPHHPLRAPTEREVYAGQVTGGDVYMVLLSQG